jgi:hypothetical protein
MNNRINIEDIKFLISRMETPRLTLNEYNEKKGNLLLEGSGIKALVNRVKSLQVGVWKGSISPEDLSKISNTKKTLNGKLDDIQINIKNNIDSGGRFPDGIGLRNSWKRYLSDILDILPDEIDKAGLLKYITGKLNKSEKIDFISKNAFSKEQIQYLDILQETTGELASYVDYLDQVQPIINAITPGNMRMGMTQLFKQILQNGEKFKSIEEIKAAFIKLDNGLLEENVQLRRAAEAWDAAKRRAGLMINDNGNPRVMSGDEITIKFKSEIENSVQYRSIKEKMLKRWRRNRSEAKGKDITYIHTLRKLNSRNIKWDKTVVYYDASIDEVVLVSFTTKSQLKKYKDILNKRKIEYDIPPNVEAGAESLTKQQKKHFGGKTESYFRFRIIKVKALWALGATGLVLLFVYCRKNSGKGDLSDEDKSKIIDYNNKNEKKIPITDPKFYDVMICGINVGSYGLTVAQNILNLLTLKLRQDFAIVVHDINEELNKVCDFDVECDCTIKCNDEDEINDFFKDSKFVNKFQEIGAKLEEEMKQASNWASWTDEQRKVEMKKIGAFLNFGGKDEDGVTYSESSTGLISKDGEIMTLGDVFRQICNSRKVECLRKKVEEVVGELLVDKNNLPKGYPIDDCEQLKSWNSVRIGKLKKWSEDKKIIIGGMNELDQVENEDKVILQKLKVRDLMASIRAEDTDDINKFIENIETNKAFQENGVCMGNGVDDEEEEGDPTDDNNTETNEEVKFLPSALWVKERAEEGFFDGWVCEIDNNNNLTGELSEVGKNLIKNEYNLEARQYFWSFVKENLGKDFENKPKEYETEIWDSMYAYFNCWQCKKEKKDACIGSVREK